MGSKHHSLAPDHCALGLRTAPDQAPRGTGGPTINWAHLLDMPTTNVHSKQKWQREHVLNWWEGKGITAQRERAQQSAVCPLGGNQHFL